MKILFESWRKFVNETENVLDLSKDLDSGFCDYNPLINEFAQSSPDGLASTLIFVIATQRARWYDVVPKFPLLLNFIIKNDGLMTDSNFAGMRKDKKGKEFAAYEFPGFGQLVMGFRKDAINYIWKNRKSIYASFKPLLKSYNSSSGLKKEEAMFEIYLQAIKTPGLGLPKAAFASQLIIGRLGCIDSINLNLYKGLAKNYDLLAGKEQESFKTPGISKQGQELIRMGQFDSNIIQITSGGVKLAKNYVKFLQDIAKMTQAVDISKKLWNSWVELVAKKINIGDDITVIMPDGSEYIVPNDYSRSTEKADKNPAAAFRKQYIGNITPQDVSRQHFIPQMKEAKNDKMLFEQWSEYFYNMIFEEK